MSWGIAILVVAAGVGAMWGPAGAMAAASGAQLATVGAKLATAGPSAGTVSIEVASVGATNNAPEGIWAPGKLDEVLQDPTLLEGYILCMLDKGNCSSEATQLKQVLASLLSANCTQCSQQQKATSNKLIRYLIDNRPAAWGSLEGRLDPQGAYRKEYLSSKAMIGPPQQDKGQQPSGKAKVLKASQDPNTDGSRQAASSSPTAMK